MTKMLQPKGASVARRESHKPDVVLLRQSPGDRRVADIATEVGCVPSQRYDREKTFAACET